MGQLQQLYGHSDIAIIGGGFHHGLHNILEALVFQNIVTFGPKTNNHWEAIKCGADILNLNADSKELKKWISELLDLDENIVKQKKKSAQDFIKNNLGATDRVIKFIDEYFN
jgi:3-deoxy-D-manno-octulosonic-acid transferase